MKRYQINYRVVKSYCTTVNAESKADAKKYVDENWEWGVPLRQSQTLMSEQHTIDKCDEIFDKPLT